MIEPFRVPPGAHVRLSEWDTSLQGTETDPIPDSEVLKQTAEDFVTNRAKEIASYQEVLWADGRRALLLIFQGMDTSGKDGTIKHVLAGVNPAGVRVTSFKAPSDEELRHNYLWRYVRALPEQGTIGIFNRSHYEEVSVVRVFPELLARSAGPDEKFDAEFWQQRFKDINQMENVVARSGTVILKFFLHISRNEQRERLLARLDDPAKQWKFNPNDLLTRDRWDEFQHAYEQAITHTNTEAAPWWVVPADDKWTMRAIVAEAVCDVLRRLDLAYPPVDDAKREAMRVAAEELGAEQPA